MRWRDLAEFADARVPKLHRLVRGRHRLRVPPTRWCPASEVLASASGDLPAEFTGLAGRCVVRSGSPSEDGDTSSAAGRFHSEVVEAGAGAEERRAALERVAESVVGTGDAAVVFVQPFIEAETAGIAFFDGFHYERASAAGGNQALTSGEERGDVVRGDLERGEAWSTWLEEVGAAFPELDRLDLEWALDAKGYVLLQARRAAFELRPNPIVSVANHREILGGAPSPWIVAVLEEAGREAFGFFARADRRVAAWGERYARVAAGRAWMDFSAFFRLMDHWGLPRTFVTEGVGGEVRSDHDRRFRWGRFLRSGPALVRLQLANLREVFGMQRSLDEVTRAVDAAETLSDLFRANVVGLATALRVNFALGGALAGVQRLRRALGITAAAEVVTGRMWRAYGELRGTAENELEAGLDRWLAEYGHRGPLESDPIQPRFVELREQLLSDLRATTTAPEHEQRVGRGPLFWFERRRERFRHELMRPWVVIRQRMLERADELVAKGELERRDDVFFLTLEDLESGRGLGECARERREAWTQSRDFELPSTARLDEVEEAARSGAQAAAGPDVDAWSGIGLGGGSVEGVVRRCEDLAELMRDGLEVLGPNDVLLVPALEPAWGVAFGRVGGVVAELGGELSHASILLRELGTPAVVNCHGAWRGLRTGERVRLDPSAGRVARAG